jgi:hypothetical protein
MRKEFVYTPLSGSKILVLPTNFDSGFLVVEKRNGSYYLVGDFVRVIMPAAFPGRYYRDNARQWAIGMAKVFNGAAIDDRGTVTLVVGVDKLHQVWPYLVEFAASTPDQGILPRAMNDFILAGGLARQDEKGQLAPWWIEKEMSNIYYFQRPAHGEGTEVVREDGESVLLGRLEPLNIHRFYGGYVLNQKEYQEKENNQPAPDTGNSEGEEQNS